MFVTILPLLLIAAATSLPGDSKTAGEFLSGGDPTFVLATQGDDATDRLVAQQVGFVQNLLFPKAEVVPDTSIDVSAGVSAWPDRPVVYGGSHLNGALAELAACLPFTISAGELEIAGEHYTGDEFRLIALVPAQAAREGCASSPQFLLYAGAGTPGVTEINATPDGGYGFAVIDRFGLRDGGVWELDKDGKSVAKVTFQALRKPWRASRVTEGDAVEAALIVHRMQAAAFYDAEGGQDATLLRGVQTSAQRLGIKEAAPLEVYLYADAATKASITRAGDGHADHASRTLHLVALDFATGGPLESLCAHEATHILATEHYGAPGSGLWGEGLAVWVAGQYGGKSLQEWRLKPPTLAPGIQLLLGPTFARTAERSSYPVAGLIVDDLIRDHGFEAFMQHIYPAGPGDIESACAKLGIKIDSLDAKLRRYRQN